MTPPRLVAFPAPADDFFPVAGLRRDHEFYCIAIVVDAQHWYIMDYLQYLTDGTGYAFCGYLYSDLP